MDDKKDKIFNFVVVGGGIAGVTCVEQVKHDSYLNIAPSSLDRPVQVLILQIEMH